jgi:hypothetical protein
MGKKSAPKAPDMTDLANISKDLGTRALDQQDQQNAWAKEQDTANRALLEKVLGVQLPIMQETFANAQKDRARYETVFQPLQDQLITDAKGYATDSRKQFEQGRAIADVNTAFDAQRKNAEANLASYGVDPTTLKAGALDVGLRTAQGAAQAAAATNAGTMVEDKGRAMLYDAVNLGSGLPAQSLQGTGQSASVGGTALGGALNTTGTGSNALMAGAQYGSQALSGFGQAGNIRSQGYQNQLAGWQASSQARQGMLDTVAGLAGGAMGAFMEKGGPVTERGALPVSPVPGSTDRKPAWLTPGEFVLDKDTVAWKGQEFFHKLQQKAKEQRAAIPMGA